MSQQTFWERRDSFERKARSALWAEKDMEGTLGVMANRIGKLLFKQSVELGILSHIIAADTDIDQATRQRLRGRCVDDVKRTNGQIQFKDILQFQRKA